MTYALVKSTPQKVSSRGPFLGCFNKKEEKHVPAGAGPWCSISADPPKPGYRIKSVSFSLTGDRTCFGNDFDREEGDASAGCRQVKRTDKEAVWEFQMLGHEESGRQTSSKSFGELHTVYEKIP